MVVTEHALMISRARAGQNDAGCRRAVLYLLVGRTPNVKAACGEKPAAEVALVWGHDAARGLAHRCPQIQIDKRLSIYTYFFKKTLIQNNGLVTL